MYCPNCGTENKDDSIYCNLCQEPLKKYAGAPSAPAAAPYENPSAPPAQSALVPPGAGFGQPGPPPPPYGGAAYPGPGPGYQAGQPGPQAYPPSYGAYPPQPGYPPYPVIIAQGASTPGEATASLVLGILGILVCPIILSVLAIVFGLKAKNMIDASGGYLGGRGVAMAGLVLGIVGLFLYTIMFIIMAAAGGFETSMLAALAMGIL